MEENIRIILEALDASQGALKKAQAEIDKLTAATKKQQTAFEKGQAIIQKQRKTLLAVGAAASAVAAAFVLTIKNTIQLGDTLNVLSQKSRFSVESLSTLSEVAKNANLEFGQFAQGMKFLNKAIAEAQNPASEAAQAFTALGISAAEIADATNDPEKFLLRVSDAFKKYKDDVQLGAVAGKIFGRDGFSWIPFLISGSKGLQEQQARIRALGGEMSGKFAKDADAFNDSLNDVSIVLRSAALNVLQELLPALQRLADTVIRNKSTVVPAFIAISAAVGLVATAFATVKIASLITDMGKLVLLIKPLAGGALTTVATGAVNAGKGFVGAAGGFGAATIAIGALVIAIGTLVVAMKTIDAEIQEQDAVAALSKQTSQITDFLRAQVKEIRALNRITEEEADKLLIQLGRGAAGGVDAQRAANISVANTIRDKTSAEVQFTEAGRKAAEELKKQADLAASFPVPGLGDGKQGGADQIIIPDTPEQVEKKKAQAQQLDTVGAQALQDQLNATEELRKSQLALAEAKNDGNETSATIAQEEILRIEAQKAAERSRLEELTQAHEEKIAQILEATETDIATDAERNDLLLEARAAFEEEQIALKTEGEATRLAIAKKADDAERALLVSRLAATATLLGGLSELAAAFGEKGFLAAKAFAIGQAIVSTALAVVNALATPPFPLGVALAVVAGALGAVQIAKIAAAKPGFSEGGIVPGPPSATDNRTANVATGELILSAAATQALISKVGLRGIGHLMDGRIPMDGFSMGGLVPRARATSSFQTGGLVGAARSANEENATTNIAMVNTRNAFREFQRKEGTKITVDQMARRGNEVHL